MKCAPNLICTRARAAPLNDVSKAIGANVAKLIPDGGCLQMGIGAIPNAVLVCSWARARARGAAARALTLLDWQAALTSHRDIGIHTEMFSDGMLELLERGVVTNRLKEWMPHQVVSTFVVGSRKTYDFIHDNPGVQMLRVSDTNNPYLIARNSNVMAINSCIEIDVSGCACVARRASLR